MIAGAIGAALMAAGLCIGLAVAYGRLGPVAAGALALVAVLLALGGGMIASFAVSVALGRIPHDDEGAVGEDEIDRMIRRYRERENRG